jgi:hypothetical protein
VVEEMKALLKKNWPARAMGGKAARGQQMQ